jgi:hypothetical protein
MTGLQRAIDGVVIVAEEDLLPAVAALSHMMRHASRHRPRQSRHDGIYVDADEMSLEFQRAERMPLL